MDLVGLFLRCSLLTWYWNGKWTSTRCTPAWGRRSGDKGHWKGVPVASRATFLVFMASPVSGIADPRDQGIVWRQAARGAALGQGTFKHRGQTGAPGTRQGAPTCAEAAGWGHGGATLHLLVEDTAARGGCWGLEDRRASGARGRPASPGKSSGARPPGSHAENARGRKVTGSSQQGCMKREIMWLLLTLILPWCHHPQRTPRHSDAVQAEVSGCEAARRLAALS